MIQNARKSFFIYCAAAFLLLMCAPARAADEEQVLYDYFRVFAPEKTETGARFAARRSAAATAGEAEYLNGTLAVLGVVRAWHALSDDARQELAPYFQEKAVEGRAAAREAYQYSNTCTSALNDISSNRQSDHFIIYYTTSSSSQDRVSSTGSGNTPDYIANLLSYAENIWSHEVDILGLQAPPLTSGRFPIYVCDIVGRTSVLGLTVTSEYYSNGTARSFIEMDNDYNSVNLYNGITVAQMIQVTLAHEFFHAIQFGLNWQYPSFWIMESTATWMEDDVYPEINDYIGQYVGTRFSNPDSPLDHFSYYDTIAYGTSIFWKYVSEKVGGSGAMADLWDLVRYDTQDCNISGCPNGSYEITEIPHLEQYLISAGTTLDAVYRDYVRANYAKDYVDGALSIFPSISPTNLGSAAAISSGTRYLDHLSSSYFRISSSATDAKRLTFSFSGNTSTDWNVQILFSRNDGSTVLKYATVTSGSGTLNTDAWGTTYKSAVIIVSNLDTALSSDDRSYLFTTVTTSACTTNFAGPALSAGWNLVTLPVLSRYGTPSTALGVSDTNMASFDPGAGAFYYGNQTGFITLGTPGVGYWLYSGGGPMSISGCSNPETYADISISPGWNIIGNPFTSSVAWSDAKVSVLVSGSANTYTLSQAVAAGWLSGTVYQYNGTGYTLVPHNSSASLAAWTGYWLEAKKEMILRISQ